MQSSLINKIQKQQQVNAMKSNVGSALKGMLNKQMSLIKKNQDPRKSQKDKIKIAILEKFKDVEAKHLLKAKVEN